MNQVLSESSLRFIRSTPTPARILADGYRVPTSVIYKIKNGTYRFPDIKEPAPPKRIGASCDQCIHWSNRCTLDFPDANAEDCGAYQP